MIFAWKAFDTDFIWYIDTVVSLRRCDRWWRTLSTGRYVQWGVCWERNVALETRGHAATHFINHSHQFWVLSISVISHLLRCVTFCGLEAHRRLDLIVSPHAVLLVMNSLSHSLSLSVVFNVWQKRKAIVLFLLVPFRKFWDSFWCCHGVCCEGLCSSEASVNLGLCVWERERAIEGVVTIGPL